MDKIVKTTVWSAGPGCHGGCGAKLHVRDGKVVKVEGDENHPWSHGRACPRLLALTQYMYHPDRITQPLKRIGERGEGKWQPISWDEAFDTVEIYSTHKEIMHLFTPNNDGINDQWELPDLATWGKSEVKVFNRWGKLVFADADYNNLWDGTSNGSPLPEGPYYFVIKTENAGVVKGTLNIVR